MRPFTYMKEKQRGVCESYFLQCFSKFRKMKAKDKMKKQKERDKTTFERIEVKHLLECSN